MNELELKLEEIKTQNNLYEGKEFIHLKSQKNVEFVTLAYKEDDLSVVIIYKENNIFWSRPVKEFFDGRFQEKLT